MIAPRITITATHSGAGKSSWTLGLLAAFRAQGVAVQPFKAGPDFIDPGLHTAVSGRISRNLDTRLMSRECVRRLFFRNALSADLSLIEGVMGYFDGAPDKSRSGLAEGSTADLAAALRCPVLLILDVNGASDSAAATALGFVRYVRRSLIRGFLLNRAGSPKHAEAVRRAVEKSTELPVFGYLPREEALVLQDRHLGLVSASEDQGFGEAVGRLREAILRTTDLGAIRAVADSAPALEEPRGGPLPGQGASDMRRPPVRIAVARDQAFSFLYEDNLDLLRTLGVRTVFFSPLRDHALPPDIGGAYFCGGYPELYADALAANTPMRASVRCAAEAGLPILAECGGYMYLLEEIVSREGRRTPGAGVLRGTAVMGKSLAALGYCQAEAINDCILAPKGRVLAGHVFHWSSVTGADASGKPALLLRTSGHPPVTDGVSHASVFASYVHFHFAGCPAAARRFVRHCRLYAAQGGSAHA